MEHEFNTINFEVTDGICYLYLNNPPANIMTRQLFEEFSLAIDEIADKDLAGLIIAGKGRHFSSGADVEMLRNEFSGHTECTSFREFSNMPKGHVRDKKSILSLSELRYPVISVIKGFCIGSGFEIALSSWFRIFENGAIIGLPESTFGFLPALCGFTDTYELCGLSKALEIVLSGKLYNVSEMVDSGIVDFMTQKHEGMALAKEFIDYLKDNVKNYSISQRKQYIEGFNKSRGLK
jgi:enoyl-CoA hydratase